MDNPRSGPSGPSGVEVAGLSVKLLRELKVASIRYFDAAGLAADGRELFGGPVPAPLAAVRYPIGESRGNLVLAWRSPTETLLMTADAAAFAALSASFASLSAAGCMVDQTGGLWPWQITGARTRDLLLRLGSAASIPSLGEAHSSRVAELPVMALCVEIGTIILLVERVYSDHLIKWISETAVDF